LHLYAFVLNQPISKIDKLGLDGVGWGNPPPGWPLPWPGGTSQRPIGGSNYTPAGTISNNPDNAPLSTIYNAANNASNLISGNLSQSQQNNAQGLSLMYQGGTDFGTGSIGIATGTGMLETPLGPVVLAFGIYKATQGSFELIQAGAGLYQNSNGDLNGATNTLSQPTTPIAATTSAFTNNSTAITLAKSADNILDLIDTGLGLNENFSGSFNLTTGEGLTNAGSTASNLYNAFDQENQLGDNLIDISTTLISGQGNGGANAVQTGNKATGNSGANTPSSGDLTAPAAPSAGVGDPFLGSAQAPL
jgi:hypothetical protein